MKVVEYLRYLCQVLEEEIDVLNEISYVLGCLDFQDPLYFSCVRKIVQLFPEITLVWKVANFLTVNPYDLDNVDILLQPFYQRFLIPSALEFKGKSYRVDPVLSHPKYVNISVARSKLSSQGEEIEMLFSPMISSGGCFVYGNALAPELWLKEGSKFALFVLPDSLVQGEVVKSARYMLSDDFFQRSNPGSRRKERVPNPVYVNWDCYGIPEFIMTPDDLLKLEDILKAEPFKPCPELLRFS